MSGRLDGIPERIYNHISEHPGADIRTVCRDIRGRLKRGDLTYFSDVIRIMEGRGLVVPEGKGWKAVPVGDFSAVYTGGKTVDADAIYDYLVQMHSSTTSGIDAALGYDAIRGCYPVLLGMERNGRISRTMEDRDGHTVWVWHPVEE